MTAGNLACRPGFVERTRTRTVAECLGPVAAQTRIPLINNHLDRHLAPPHAARALFLICLCRKSPMTALPVDRKWRWNPAPRGRLCLSLNFLSSDFQIADLIKIQRSQDADRQPAAHPRIPCHRPGNGVGRERLSLRQREILGPHFRYCRVPLTCSPDMYGYADRKSGSTGSAVVPKSIHRSTGSSQLHCSARKSSRTPLQSVFVM